MLKVDIKELIVREYEKYMQPNKQDIVQMERKISLRGYIIDKKRMENGAFIDEDYFEHLLSEIREIRMSERRFYQKLTDIYATSIDYHRDAPTTRIFYKKMQNKTLLHILS